MNAISRWRSRWKASQVNRPQGPERQASATLRAVNLKLPPTNRPGPVLSPSIKVARRSGFAGAGHYTTCPSPRSPVAAFSQQRGPAQCRGLHAHRRATLHNPTRQPRRAHRTGQRPSVPGHRATYDQTAARRAAKPGAHMITCPACAHPITRVTETRGQFRDRTCPNCKRHFTTREAVLTQTPEHAATRRAHEINPTKRRKPRKWHPKTSPNSSRPPSLQAA